VLTTVAALAVPAAPGHAGDASGRALLQDAEKPKKHVEADAVYFGDAAEWKKPAVVDADAVFREIDEYKQILEEKLESSDPKYGVLMSKASRRFSAAVRAAAKEGEYDLVARVGSVHGVDSVPVITQDVIRKL
jgi:hypothetical protein